MPSVIVREKHKHRPAPTAQEMLRTLSRPWRLAIAGYAPRVTLAVERGAYLVKTAETPAELEQALVLRHDVFYREMLGRRKMLGIDMDRFDTVCDHLVVIERATGECVGTYRLNCSSFNASFYAETEFDISALKRLEGPLLELGRACIHRSHRNGLTIALLWRGITEYLRRTGSRYLFGCSSVRTGSLFETGILSRYLLDRHQAPEGHRAAPRPEHRVPGLANYLNLFSDFSQIYIEQISKGLISPLLSSYLRLGAEVCGEPAFDPEFRCADFLTLLDVSRLSPQAERKFSS